MNQKAQKRRTLQKINQAIVQITGVEQRMNGNEAFLSLRERKRKRQEKGGSRVKITGNAGITENGNGDAETPSVS